MGSLKTNVDGMSEIVSTSLIHYFVRRKCLQKMMEFMVGLVRVISGGEVENIPNCVSRQLKNGAVLK